MLMPFTELACGNSYVIVREVPTTLGEPVGQKPDERPANVHFASRPFPSEMRERLATYKEQATMYRISQENRDLMARLRGSQAAYASFRANAIVPPLENAHGEIVATSPLAAMDMDGMTIQSELPITVTITLTTVLWPRTAH